jgi:hypothetical protein
MRSDPTAGSRVGWVRSSFDWTFRNRKTGKVTVAQFPNWSLGIFLVASLVRRLVDPTHTPRTLLDVVVVVSLAWWAVDEVIRGVNPWRRFLGATVLTAVVVSRFFQ